MARQYRDDFNESLNFNNEDNDLLFPLELSDKESKCPGYDFEICGLYASDSDDFYDDMVIQPPPKLSDSSDDSVVFFHNRKKKREQRMRVQNKRKRRQAGRRKADRERPSRHIPVVHGEWTEGLFHLTQRKAARECRKARKSRIQFESGDDPMWDTILSMIKEKIPGSLVNTVYTWLDTIYRIYNSRSYVEISAAVGAFINYFYGLDQAFPKLSKITSLLASMAFKGAKLQHESWGSSFTSVGVNLNHLLSSEVVVCLRTLFGLGLSYQLFKKEHLGIMSFFAIIPVAMPIADLISYCLKAVGKILDSFEHIYNGVPIMDCLKKKDEIGCLLGKADELKVYHKKLYVGAPIQGYMDERMWLCQSKECIQNLQYQMKKQVTGTHRYNSLKMLSIEIEHMRDTVLKAQHARNRFFPISFMLVGGAGVGKSKLLDLLVALCCTYKGVDNDPSVVYHKILDSDYYDGLICGKHWIYHYSEVGAQSRTMAERNGESVLYEIQNVMDAQFSYANMAFDKATEPHAPEVLLLDTNNETLNASIVMTDPFSIYRRLWSIKIEVQQDFRKEGSHMLDVAKSLQHTETEGSNILDRYNFDVRYGVRNEDGTCSWKSAFRTKHVQKFSKFILVLLDDHYKKQAKVSNMISKEVLQEFTERAAKMAPLDMTVLQAAEFLRDPLVAASEEEEKYSSVEVSNPHTSLQHETGEVYGSQRFYDFEEKEDLFEEKDDYVPPTEEAYIEAWKRHLALFGLRLDSEPVESSNIDPEPEQIYPNVPRAETLESRNYDYHFNDMSRCQAFYLWIYYSAWVKFLSYVVSSVHLTRLEETQFFPKFFSFMKWVLCIILFCYSPFFVGVIFIISRLIASLPERIVLWGAAKVFPSWMRINCVMLDPRLMLQNLISMRLMQYMHIKDECWSRMWRVPPKVTKNLRMFTAITALAAGVVALASWILTRKKVRYVHEESTSNTDLDHSLRDIEEKSESTYGIRRVHNKRENTWKIPLSANSAVFTGSLTDFGQCISRNVRSIQCYEETSDTVAHTQYMLMLKSHYAIINTHFIEKTDHIVVYSYGEDARTTTTKGRLVHISANEKIDLGNDISLIRVVGEQAKDITKHISNHIVPDTRSCRLHLPGYRNLWSDTLHTDKVTLTADELKQGDYYVNEAPRGKGKCGLPLVAKVNYTAIAVIGIHAAGNLDTGESYFAPLLRGKLEEALDVLVSRYEDFPVASYNVELKVEDPVSKSPFVHETFSNIDYLGKLPGPITIKNKSKLIRNPLKRELGPLLMEIYDFIPTNLYGKPHMQPLKVDGEWNSPYNVGLRKMNVTPPSLNSDMIKFVTDRLVTHVIDGFTRNGVESMSPWLINTAINGNDQDSYMRRINVSTSAGSYPGKKKDYFPLVDASGTTREMVDLLKMDYVRAVEMYQDGQCFHEIVRVCLKDEPRTLDKIQKFATRLFYIVGTITLTLSRSYLAPFYTRVVQLDEVFGSAVGINVYKDGDRYFKRLNDFSSHIIEGDYSGFDVSMPLEISMAASNTCYRVLKYFGYNEYALNIVSGLLSDGLYPLLDMNKDVFFRCGMQPSGKYATAEDNSIRGLIMLMYAWYSIMGSEYDFFDYCQPLIYGDDVLVAVKESVSDLFNAITYSDFCETHFNMRFTTASKGDVDTPYQSIWDSTFLKRKFVYSPSRDRIIMPIDLDSLFKTLSWTMPSNSETLEGQMKSTLTSMLYEIYFQEEDEKRFNEVRHGFVEAFFNRFGFDPKLPRFTEIWARMEDSPSNEITLEDINLSL